jgi:hypothetical protein
MVVIIAARRSDNDGIDLASNGLQAFIDGSATMQRACEEISDNADPIGRCVIFGAYSVGKQAVRRARVCLLETLLTSVLPDLAIFSHRELSALIHGLSYISHCAKYNEIEQASKQPLPNSSISSLLCISAEDGNKGPATSSSKYHLRGLGPCSCPSSRDPNRPLNLRTSTSYHPWVDTAPPYPCCSAY